MCYAIKVNEDKSEGYNDREEQHDVNLIDSEKTELVAGNVTKPIEGATPGARRPMVYVNDTLYWEYPELKHLPKSLPEQAVLAGEIGECIDGGLPSENLTANYAEVGTAVYEDPDDSEIIYLVHNEGTDDEVFTVCLTESRYLDQQNKDHPYSAARRSGAQ